VGPRGAGDARKEPLPPFGWGAVFALLVAAAGLVLVAVAF
jgi:hypothetical protein